MTYSLDWLAVILFLALGIYGILRGRSLRRRPDAVKPGSRLCRRFETLYRMQHWGDLHKDFDKVAHRYIGFQGKHSIRVGILVTIVGVVLGVMKALGG